MFPVNDVPEFSARDLFKPAIQDQLLNLSPEKQICILFDGTETEFPGFLFTLKDRFKTIYFALRLSRSARLARFVKKVPFWILKQLHVLPAAFDVNDPLTLTCSETQKQISFLREQGALAKPLPYRDFADARGLQTSGESLKWHSKVSEKQRLSVIVPTRNYETFLINVLKHLFDQDLPFADYEVLVIDDGGADHSLEKTRTLLGPLSSRINFKYIYCPRPAGTEEQFRAGHCRNIGLAYSVGDWVLFLDSDILLKRDFLSGLLQQSSTADVIQCPRLHIRPEKSDQDTALASLASTDTYLEEPGYWGVFFNSPDWSQIPSGWRYTCTYCLAVRRAALRQVGGFRQVFTSYGFEDTELGFRLHQAGFKFLLWKENVFHLTPPKNKSRYYHSIWRKQILLSKTGKTFFLSTLDLEVYQMFRIYMRGEYKWQQRLYGFYRK